MKKQINTLHAVVSNTADKKSYATPTLQKFGAVKHLTAGGSGTTSENCNNTGVKAKSKNWC